MIDTNLHFDEASHRYTSGDRVMASVTQILKSTFVFSDYRFSGPQYRMRGRAVHEACRLFDLGEYDEAGTHPEIRPYVRSFAEFVKVTGFKGIVWELAMVNSVLGVAGTLDVIGRTRDSDELLLVDVKSGQCPKMVHVQIAAYEHLLMTGKFVPSPDLDKAALDFLHEVRTTKPKIQRRSLQLTPEKYTLRPQDQVDGYAIWFNSLSQYNTWKKYDLVKDL
jgi:hypothetical protein